MTTSNTHVPLGGVQLTDEALRVIGIEPSVPVPLVELPWRPDVLDRKPDHDQENTGDR